MELSEIKIGTKLELEVENSMAGDDRRVYISQFEWLENDNTAAIAAPIYEGRVVPLETGTLIDIYFLVGKGQLIDLYKFTAVIRSRGIVDNIHILLIEKPGEIVRIQRRSFYRLDVILEVQYRNVSDFIGEYNGGIPYKKALATDLSGGGISIVTGDKLENGSLLECWFLAGDYGKVSFTGKTVRCERIITESRYKYLTGIEFTDISDNCRERVIRFIFSEQRKLIKKGMI